MKAEGCYKFKDNVYRILCGGFFEWERWIVLRIFLSLILQIEQILIIKN
jgi:hypothetical protein